jgi:primosomal protein N' (replication factor Y)
VKDASRIVNVYFTSPPFGPYGYRVPPGLSPIVTEGVTVSVRIGKRVTVGIVGEDAEREDIEYRDVESVLGASPFVPPVTMTAARFAATYYAAGPGEALRLALPVPLKTARVDYYYATERYVREPDGFSLEPAERELAESVKRFGWFRVAGPVDGAQVKSLARLVEAGAVAADYGAARPDPDDCILTTAEGADELPELKGTRQRNLWDVLERSGGSAPLRELTDAGVPASTITRTCDRGYIAAYLRVNQPAGGTGNAEKQPTLIAGGASDERLERAIDGLSDLVKQDRQALIVVPEVYRVKTAADFVRRETDIDVFEYHSGVSPGRRFRTFRRVSRGTVNVIVGTRSALFLPFVNLGLTAVLDEQDPSHKQTEMAPFYASRETATVVAWGAGSRLVFTSAAPSGEAYRAAREGRWRLTELGPAVRNRPRFVDMDEEIKAVGPTAIISRTLQKTVRSSFESGRSAVLIIDRRGYVPYVYCETCGYVFRCHRCDVAMVYHLDENAMRCHHCGSAEPFPSYCPECHKRTLVGIGLGTEKVAAEATRLFPGAAVARCDGDALPTARRAAEFWRRFDAGELDVVVGTRMALRGAGSPRAGVIGVVSADTALTLPDFRASERTFQLVVRLAEEVRPGTPLVVQTFYGSHHCFTAAVDGDYDAFWRAEMPLREKLKLPPYRRLVLVRLDGKDEEKVAEEADETAAAVRAIFGDRAEIVGPVPAPIKKLKDRYRMQVLVKTDAPEIFRRGAELAALNRPGGKRTVGVRVDVDPMEFL